MESKNDSKDKKYKAFMDWKKSYIELLIDELKPFGDTLEIGFGLGISAERLQKYEVKSHTIIEVNPQIAEKAKIWSTKHNNVRIIQDSWQNALPNLGIFDAIFFNAYPIESGEELSSEDASGISNSINTLLVDLKNQMSQINIKFTDKEIDEFYNKIGQFNLNVLPEFLNGLKNRGNISPQQYENSIKKYKLENKSINQSSELKEAEPMLTFLEACINNHMKIGSRFTSFLLNSKSKFEDTVFFDRIITTPELEYTENLVPIKSFEDKPREALLFIVKKIA